MDTEKIREDVYEYLSDNLDEASTIAEKYDYDWLEPYNGINNLFHGYFGGDLEEIISAFRESDVSVGAYETYYVDENGFNIALYTDYEIDDLVENHIDDVVDSLMDDIENGNLDYIKDDLSEDLLKIIKSTPSHGDLMKICFEDVVSAHMLIKKTIEDNLDPHDSAIRYALSSELYHFLEITKFCGIPEELYGEIDCCGLIEHIVDEYYTNCYTLSGCGVGGMTIQKYAEVKIKSYFKLGVYK